MTPLRLALPMVCLAACDSSSPVGPAAPADVVSVTDATANVALPDVVNVVAPAEPVTVTLFDRTHMYFAGADNRRTVDASAQFPERVVGRYARATLTLTLACPSGRCDAWDRVAALSVLDDSTPVDDAGAPAELEFARFVTPYGVGGTWTLNVTDVMPLFQGARRLRAFIDTWVGPGNAQGNGWLVTASIAFEPGVAEHPTRAVIPLGWSHLVYGDPARPTSSQLPTRTITVPEGTRGAKVWVSATGHGQGNRGNCAEFCQRTHRVVVDGTPYEHDLWRADCRDNPISNQRGNWQPSRAGWCPGDIAAPWVVELPPPSPGAHTVAYDVDPEENTCRPGATPCVGCVFGTSCEYNDSSHTEPYYRLAAFLLLTD